MKRKKRRSNGTSVDNCGSGKEQTAEYSEANDDRMHVLTVCDDLEGFLAPSTPDIHRVRIPAAGERGDLLRRGVFRLSNQGGVTLNPKPCDTKSIETGITAGGSCLDLKLSPEALKEPSHIFIEGFEKLLEMKFGIMAVRIRHGLDAWSLGSHMINPFEILSFVAATSVLNRAYFKMWELIQTFDLVPTVANNQRFLSAHLCEGPGGFIEAVLDYRAQSVMSEEDGGRVSEGMDGEFHRGDSSISSTVVDKAERNSRSDDYCPLPKLSSNGSAGSGRPSPILDSPCATNGLKNRRPNRNTRVTICGNNPNRVPTVHPSPVVNSCKHRSDSLCAIDRSRGNEGNQKAILKSPRAIESLSKLSDPRFEIIGGECQRGDTAMEPDKFEVGCEIIAYSGVREIWTDPLSPSSSVVDRKNHLYNKPSSFGSSRRTSKEYHDLWFGLTLASTQQCGAGGCPPPRMETKRLNEKVDGNSQGHVHYGVDGTGDLTNPANVSAFVEYTLGRSDGQRMDLVTADGAFDVSEDFSSQEHSHLNLVFCEVVSALRLQAEGGSFVLKLFDCYTASTLTILFILSSLYRNVEIVRLRTTRICNSERYVVAKGFFGLSPQLEETLLRLTEEWNMASLKGDKVGVLLSGGFPEQLLHAVMESNAAISAVQIDGINRALQLADVIGERLPSSDSFGRRKGSVSMLRRKLQTQKRMQRNAIALCHELHIPCRSQFSIE